MYLSCALFSPHGTRCPCNDSLDHPYPPLRPSSRQGKALGLVANIESLSAIVSPVVWGYVYRASVGWSAGLAFFAMGGTAGVAFALSLGLRAPSQLASES